MRALTALEHLARRFRSDRRGTAAVEFSLILLPMIIMFMSVSETSKGYLVYRKTQFAARSASDLASRLSAITTTDFNDILSAAEAIIAPYTATNMTITLTGIAISTTGTATVKWSTTRRGTAYSCGSTVTVPANMKPTVGTAGFVVLAETAYSYKPDVAYNLTGTLTLKGSLYTYARTGTAIALTPAQC